MQIAFFSVPARGDAGLQEDLNVFLRSHRVLTVHREFVGQGENAFWALAVEYLDGPVLSGGGGATRGGKERVDYKEVLSPADFALFAKLRDWRKGVAEKEGVPVYTVLTNEQLAAIGMAVHGFLAADRPEYPAAERLKMAETLLANWSVKEALASEAILLSSDNLRAWINSHWPSAVWHREWPLTAKLENGSILRGSADLVLETEAGFVLLDHKSYPGSQERVAKKAVEFGGQLGAYATVLSAALGKPLLGCFIHMPINGLVVPVKELPSPPLAHLGRGNSQVGR